MMVQEIAYDFAPKTKLQWLEVRHALLREFKGQCTYCETQITIKTMEIDHAIPRCQGGTDHYSNLHASCRFCNRSKGGRNVWQWREPADYLRALNEDQL